MLVFALVMAVCAQVFGSERDADPRKSVRLTFGERIQAGEMHIDQGQLESVFREEHERAVMDGKLTPVYLSKTPGGTPTGAHAQFNGRLHGPSVLVDDDGHIRSVVNYTGGAREGRARFWDEKEPRLLVKYKKGKKDGVLCYYSGGRPTVAQLWKSGLLISACLIDTVDGELKALEEIDLTESQRKVMDLCLGDIVKIETDLDASEKTTKKGCLDWYKAESEKHKKRLAAAKSAAAREAARDRNAARDQANSEALNELLSRGARSAGW